MLRLKINQGKWYENETLLEPRKLEGYPHVKEAIHPFSGYGLEFCLFPIRLGRVVSNHIILDDPTVSRTHAEITQENDSYFIQDLESKAGTRVADENGKNKEGLEGKIPLAPGDYIALGETILEVMKPK